MKFRHIACACAWSLFKIPLLWKVGLEMMYKWVQGTFETYCKFLQIFGTKKIPKLQCYMTWFAGLVEIISQSWEMRHQGGDG